MKAMMGAGLDPQTMALLDEIRSLRTRVHELEHALDEAERAQAEVDVEVDIRTGVLEPAGQR